MYYKLYYYQLGSLVKWTRRQKFYRIEDVDAYINTIKMKNLRLHYQFVLVEYKEPYNSKIVKIYNNGENI